MGGANLDPLFGLVIGSGTMSIPHTTTNTPTTGPSTVMQTIMSQLSPPILTSKTVSSIIHGGRGPSTTIPDAVSETQVPLLMYL